MVRYEDPPGNVKHIRLGKVGEPILSALESFPGIRAIVCHTHGKTGEHPHYHIWWEGTARTNQTLRNQLKAASDVFKAFSGQQDWSFRNHDNYEAWCKYVTANLSHQVIKSDAELDKAHQDAPKLPIVLESPIRGVSPATPAATPRAPRKLTSEEKMVAFIKSEYHWTEGEFNVWQIEHMEPLAPKGQTYAQKCREAVVAYTRGRVYNNQLIALTRNVMFVFGDDEVKNWLKSTIGKSLEYL